MSDPTQTIGGMEELMKTVEGRARAAERDEILDYLKVCVTTQRASADCGLPVYKEGEESGAGFRWAERAFQDAVDAIATRGTPLTYSRNELGRVMLEAGGGSGWENIPPAHRERYCCAAEAVATYVGAKVTDITVVADPGPDASSD